MRVCACQFIPYNNRGFLKNIFEMKVAGYCDAKRQNPSQNAKIKKIACILYVFYEFSTCVLVINSKIAVMFCNNKTLRLHYCSKEKKKNRISIKKTPE
jgi:hypothetical protein